MRIGILGGKGEVGTSIAKFYDKPLIKDLDRDDFEGRGKLDILHICIPYDNDFIDNIWGSCLRVMNDGLIIIHSTVELGTTKHLKDIINELGIVHSPVRGIHPNIHEGLRTFVKYIGCDDVNDGIRVKKHFDTLGITSKIIQGSRNTEAGKIWSTSQYGILILLEKEIYHYCKENDLNFDVVYGEFNRSYNQGFRELGHGHYNRPIIKHMDGACGGHCIRENSALLDSYSSDVIYEINKGIEDGRESEVFSKRNS